MSDFPDPAPVVEVLAALRHNVMGLCETVLSTVDGLLIAADTELAQAESVAALSASAQSVAWRLAKEVGGGTLKELITRSSGRHVVIESVGERALLTVIGDESLDIIGLHTELRVALDSLLHILQNDT